MEHLTENEKKQRNIERLVLFIYSCFGLYIIHSAITNQWDRWSVMMLTMGLAGVWIIHLTRYKTFVIRALITSIVIILTCFFYGLFNKNPVSVLPVIFVLTTLIGLYGMKEYVAFAAFSYILVIVHEIGSGTISGRTDMSQVMELIGQVINLIFLVLVLFVWISNRENDTKKIEAVLRERMEAERGKNDFVANVSHEIRTPLNSISGLSEVLQEENDPELIRKYARDIQQASRQLKYMVSDILDYSELLTGEIELEEEIYNISSTVNDVINMTMAQIGDKNIELVVDLDISLPQLLQGDEKKIRRIIMNLINNAVKYTENGCILIKISGRRESYGMNLAISVSDTGIGISEENLEKLFSNYNQVDTSRNRQGSGIGLGIAISRLLSQKLGGVLSVNSKEGKGSRFTLVVPQKVVVKKPIVEIEQKSSISVAYYFNIEKFHMTEIRDSYTDMVNRMIAQMDVPCQPCSNLEDLQRRVERKHFSHIFITSMEYREAPEYFRELANQTKVVVILDEKSDMDTISGNMIKLQKPFYAMSVATIFANPTKEDVSVPSIHERGFIAPTAKIMVVDDNLMNIRVLEKLLEKYQIKVERALSGPEALEKIGQMDFDFVFMDHMMPGMDGVEVTHRIRERLGSYYQKLPIIALTANAIAGSREMFIREGMNDFLEKPIEPSVLERVLRRNLPNDKLVPIEESQENIPKNTVEKEPVLSDAAENPGEEKDYDEGFTISPQEEFSKSTPQEPKENIWKLLDTESGVLFCGGEESYREILAENVRFYDEMYLNLVNAFNKEDFTDYVIRVHALKSSMKIIGANKLSERAKELEFAGKAGEFDIIREKHLGLVTDFKELMRKISKDSVISELLGEDFVFSEAEVTEPTNQGSEDSSKENLGKETLQELQNRFEGAMYELDEETMRAVCGELRNYSLNGQDLKPMAEKLLHKVDMGDFFSAGDVLKGLKAGEKEDET